MKNRKNRWQDRSILKRDSNRGGNLDATHPQARRAIEAQLDQLPEALSSRDGLEVDAPTMPSNPHS